MTSAPTLCLVPLPQLINLTFYIVPNAYVVTHACAWFHPLVLWSGFVRRAAAAVCSAGLGAPASRAEG